MILFFPTLEVIILFKQYLGIVKPYGLEFRLVSLIVPMAIIPKFKKYYHNNKFIASHY